MTASSVARHRHEICIDTIRIAAHETMPNTRNQRAREVAADESRLYIAVGRSSAAKKSRMSVSAQMYRYRRLGPMVLVIAIALQGSFAEAGRDRNGKRFPMVEAVSRHTSNFASGVGQVASRCTNTTAWRRIRPHIPELAGAVWLPWIASVAVGEFGGVGVDPHFMGLLAHGGKELGRVTNRVVGSSDAHPASMRESERLSRLRKAVRQTGPVNEPEPVRDMRDAHQRLGEASTDLQRYQAAQPLPSQALDVIAALEYASAQRKGVASRILEAAGATLTGGMAGPAVWTAALAGWAGSFGGEKFTNAVLGRHRPDPHQAEQLISWLERHY